MNRFIRQLLAVWLMLVTALATTPASSQFTSDIDIYGAPVAATDAPNVLIVLDNTANWSTMFSREIGAMISAFNALPENKFRVGLMMFTETGGGDSNIDGGYVRAAIRMLDADYRARLGALLNSLHVNNDKSNGGKAGLTMMEAYYYFAGKAPRSGNNKNKTDYTGNTFGTTASQAITALAGNALPSKAGSPYSSPVVSGCARNYIIYISNGAVQDNNADTTTASSGLTAEYNALGMTRPPDITGLTPNGSQGNVADEWARFMRASPQRIATYTLDVDPVTTGQGPGWSALLRSMARNSGGEYFKIDSSVNNGAQIVDALVKIFNQIQAVNSVFASASLPVSVNARGTYLNQVFMGMFRPDGDAKPRWRGNLKQYRFGYDPVTDSLSLVDANGNEAVSGATGFISPAAVSYWTQPSGFWINQPTGTPPTGSDSPDGEVVEKGGIAQGMRSAWAASQSARKVYTCIGCGANTNLSTSSSTQVVTSNSALSTTLLNVSSAAERVQVIDWIRGTDNAGDEQGPGGTVTVRPSVHGDVLHSRPAVVNYGTPTGVVVFYGANDGMLHAVNGNQTGVGAGQSLWGFVPAEHMAKFKRLRDNSPEIRLSTTVMSTITGTVTPLPRQYFVDGPIGVYQKINASGGNDQVVIFPAMRRGGRFLYALDVTDPVNPRFLWKRSSADTGFEVLGQTWSEPKAARVKGHSNPVLIMGAGYDPVAEDTTPPGTTTMGNAVLVVDALTGALLRAFSTQRSVPADITLVDTDNDGFIDRAYAADVGGNIYRIAFETGTSNATADWGHWQLAALGGTPVRKFFYPPDVVVTGGFTAVLAGTGDREKPLATTSADRFFTIYDTHTGKGTPGGTVTPLTPSDLGLVGSAESKVKGCYIPMRTAGEKIVNAPTTVAGVTYFSTNQPSPPATGTCSANLGVARAYSAPLFCKTAQSSDLVGGGLPPSPVTGIVTVSYTSPETGQTVEKQVPFIIGAPNAKASGIEGKKVDLGVPPTRKRRYWYLENAR